MRYWAGFGCLILLCTNAFAASPIASASSSQKFVLRGAEVPVEGVPSWPVFGGDQIVAGKANVAVKFNCGSHVYLHPGTDARVAADGSKIIVNLSQGDVTYKLSKGCPLALVGLDGEPVAVPEAGSAALVKGAIVLGAAGAGGAAYGISQAVHDYGTPPSVSPSR